VPQPQARRLTEAPLRTALRAAPSFPSRSNNQGTHSLCDTDEVIEIVLLDALNSVTTTSNCVTTTGTRAFARFAQHSAPSHAIT
jgi:hypothetical protein